VRVSPLRYLALHKSAENGSSGFPRNLITLTSSLPPAVGGAAAPRAVPRLVVSHFPPAVSPSQP